MCKYPTLRHIFTFYSTYSPPTTPICLLQHIFIQYSAQTSLPPQIFTTFDIYSPLWYMKSPSMAQSISYTHLEGHSDRGVLQKSASRRIKENHLCGATSRIWGNKVPSSWDAKYSKHGPPSECLHEASMTLRRIIKLWTPSRHVRNHFTGYLHEPKCKSAWKPC